MSKMIHPPKYALEFLRWFCREDYLEEVEGNLLEIFETEYPEHPGRANRHFYWQVLLHFRPDFIKHFAHLNPLIHLEMFLNYVKHAWRHLWKRKEFSLLNLLGLSIGMVACLLILQYVKYETSYDDFHHEGETLYRFHLGMTEPGETAFDLKATNHPGAGPAAKKDFPQVEEYARLVDLTVFTGSSVLSYKPEGEEIRTFYEENMYVGDSSFLTMFNYPLIAGDPKTALREPTNIVISESMARRYFGMEDPIGKSLFLNGKGEGKVSGVLKDLPANTHLNIQAIFSASGFSKKLNSTWIWPEFYTYLKLAPGTKKEDVEIQLDGFAQTYMGAIMEEFGIQEKLLLQPVQDIHLSGNLSKEASENGNAKTVSFLVLIAIMILVIAWLNFINLSTSRSLERANEVGIRKVIGARKGSLILQFLTESALINLFAISFAIIMVFLLTKPFNQLVGKPFISDQWLSKLLQEPVSWMVLVGMFIGGSILAGLYPAFVLSSFKPIKTLKGKMFTSGKKFQLRHVLVVFQFSISIIMIVGTLIVFNQLSYMRNQDMGFNMDQLLILKTPSVIDSTFMDRSTLFRDQLTQSPHIHHATASSDIPGHIIQNNNSIKLQGRPTEEAVFATYLFTDQDYLDTYEMEILAGRNFSKELQTDHEAVILNAKAVEQLGFQNKEEIIGQMISIKLNNWRHMRVVGVVNNVNHRSLTYEQEAFAYFNPDFPAINYYSIRLSTTDLAETLDEIEEQYSAMFPENPFEYFFLDTFFAQQYKADQQFGKVFSLFAGLAILVACLGLLGLASHITSRRIKETGIRKILGATPTEILVLLGKQFVWLVGIAAVLAIPLAWWGGQQWLSNFAYKTHISMWVFVLPVLAVLLASIATVSWQARKAAMTNPADALRYE
ncbi:MAG: ABC transporter permease [Bacteroidota bacterium]